MAYDILQSSTQSALLFLLVQSSDHITGLTGASPTVTLSKNGASFGSPAGAVSEIGSGWYKVAANATDTNTLGPLALHATAASGDPCDIIVANIVAFNPQTTSLGLSLAKTTNITGFNDIAATAVVSSGAITTSGGAVSTVTAVTNGVTVTTNSDKTGYALSASQTFNMTGNITGNLSGSVGTVTGGVVVTTNNDKTGYSLTQTFPTNFASMALTVGGAVTVGTNGDKTGYSLTQSFPANFASLAITAGGVASADVKYVNGTQVTGNGQSGTEWGPV